jgi:hypothetical protein
MLSKKIRNKALTFLARQEDQTPVTIADIAKTKIFRLSFWKVYYCFAPFRFWAKKGKAEDITN